MQHSEAYLTFQLQGVLVAYPKAMPSSNGPRAVTSRVGLGDDVSVVAGVWLWEAEDVRLVLPVGAAVAEGLAVDAARGDPALH